MNFRTEESPVFKLTNDQETALAMMLQMHDIFILSGFAGSGKSTVISELVNTLRESGKHVIVTAPTHKSLSVIEGDCTIHSYLGLKLTWENDKQVLVRSGIFDSKVSYNDVLVIDEISMLQSELVDYILEEQENSNLKIIGVGDPCLAKGTEIIMSDGNVKKIEDVLVGDYVMGPDSKPRKVLAACCGFSEMYDVEQYGGMNYKVTPNHKIAFKRRKFRKNDGVFKDKLSEENVLRGRRTPNRKYEDSYRYPSYGDYPLIRAKNAVNLSNKFHEKFGGYNVDIKFEDQPVLIDPYYLGYWLGDGDSTWSRVSTADFEILNFCKEYAEEIGLKCSYKWYDKKHYYRISINSGSHNALKNPILDNLRKYYLINNKHIPEDYLINSRKNRLKLLAGLIDSDGYYDKVGNRYVFGNKNKKLIDDVERLAFQLGFRCKMQKTEMTDFYNSKILTGDFFYNLRITGNIDEIPCIIKRKIAKKTRSRNLYVTKLKISKSSPEEFYGIEVDKDNLFLLKDCTVLSNCQIQPINEKISPIWKLKTPKFALTEIVRQARDSGIISLATAVRTGILRPGGDFSRYVNNTDVFSGNIHQMKKFFCENFEKGEDKMPVIISHKNKIVNSANTWARNIVKNNPTEPFLVGEKVYIRSTNDHQEHNLEDIVEITKISNKFKYLKMKVPHVFYVFRVEIKSHKGEDILYIPASEKDSEIIQINKKELASLARSFKIPWSDFWMFSESISEVKHVYAMTAHRSQGSTYKNVVINFDDIQNKNILYTAITRASEKVFLLKE